MFGSMYVGFRCLRVLVARFYQVAVKTQKFLGTLNKN